MRHYYKPGDLYQVTQDLLCDELSPNRLKVGSVVMILDNHEEYYKTRTLYKDKIIVFSNVSLEIYAKKIINK